MTPYEVIATIPIVIALIQPWVIAAWKKFFRPLKVSDYQIELSISHSDSKNEIYTYRFSLNQDKINEFRNNIDEAMLCELKTLYYQPINLSIFQKSFVASEEECADT